MHDLHSILFPLLFCLNVVDSSPTIPASLNAMSNVSTALTTSGTNSTSYDPSPPGAESDPICVPVVGWSQPSINYKDCMEVIDFLHTQTEEYAENWLEFAAKEVVPPTGQKFFVITPRRWKKGESSSRYLPLSSSLVLVSCVDVHLRHMYPGNHHGE